MSMSKIVKAGQYERPECVVEKCQHCVLCALLHRMASLSYAWSGV